MGERRRKTGTFEIQRTTGSQAILDRLFLYGTLRQGQSARSLIAGQITKSAAGSTTGEIYAFPMGYPGFVEGDGTGSVLGEVVWLADLAATFGLLDAFEGPDYARVLRQITLLDSGEVVWAWIYALSDPEAVKLGTRIDHGDWVRYWTEQS